MKYFLYFLFGGIITSSVTYLANHSKGLSAAFVGTLPIITISTFAFIYLNTGQDAVLSYARGLLVMIIPWVIFIISVVLFTPKTHFVWSLIIGLCLQMITALVIFAVSGKFTSRL